MSFASARSLADMRLLQTVRLLEQMLEHADADVEAVSCALGAVMDAHSSIRSLRSDVSAG